MIDNREQFLKDLAEIVAFDSVERERSAADAPFGAEVRGALDCFLNKASYYGLKVGENGGYYGWAEYGDPEKPLIGILAHADIVPAGGGWTSDPFTVRRDGDVIYGRGVADDKGPLVTMLYVLKKLRDEKVKLRHRVRLIVGCNEETGSLCLKKYAEEGEIPVVSLVPDSDFPVINSEKGILHTDVAITPDEQFTSSVASLRAGTRANVVPGEASVTLKSGSAACEKLRALIAAFSKEDVFSTPELAENLMRVGAKPSCFAVTENNDGLTITASGIYGHAMAPEKADNALWKIWAALEALIPGSKTVDVIFDKLCRPDSASVIGAYREDAETGKLTMNMGVAEYDGGELTLKFDFRLPISANPDETESALKSVFGDDASIKRARFADNLYIPEDSPLIRTLLGVYSSVTGKKNPRPIQTGGGTYARELPNAVAYGPTEEDEVTDLHNADEHIALASLDKLFDVYVKAIEKLDELY